jgi:hypothetical protein
MTGFLPCLFRALVTIGSSVIHSAFDETVNWYVMAFAAWFFMDQGRIVTEKTSNFHPLSKIDFYLL